MRCKLFLKSFIAGILLCLSANATFGALPTKVFAPYVDVSLYPTFSLINCYNTTGQKYYTLAFIVADYTGQPSWGGVTALSTNFMLDQINQIRAVGGDVIISFGGANGTVIDGAITNVTSLVAAYSAVIDKYSLTWIDFDIEGWWVADAASIDRRNQAAKQLQTKYPGLRITYCLPAMPTGLTADGINIINKAKAAGVNIYGVNVMAMDYGSANGAMGSAAISAAQAARSQTGLNVGITPMIGQNDSQGEIFSLSDASQLLSWANSNSYVNMLAMWSATRDNGGCPGTAWASATCSGISQSNFAFINTFKSFSGGGPTPPPPPPPPTCNTVNIPGTVQAESYCSMSGVQTETTTDAGGGQDVGYIETNDWMSYRINVPTTGSYTVQYRVASLSGGGSIRLEKLGGGTTFGTISVPSTGGWQTWTTISQSVSLTAGTQDIAIVAAAGGFNINWFSISGGTPPPPPPPSGIPYGSYITLKGSNSMFVSSENGTTAMYCNRTTAQAWEKFLVVDAGGGLVALQAGSNGLYVTGSSPMYATSTSIGSAQKFSWISPASGQVQLKCSSNSLFVSSENGTAAMNCNRAAAQGWETFTWATSTKSTADDFTNSNPDKMLSVKSTLVSDQLELVNNLDSRVELKIIDLSGRVLIQKSLETGYNSIDVSILKHGMYIIKANQGNNLITVKFIKQ